MYTNAFRRLIDFSSFLDQSSAGMSWIHFDRLHVITDPFLQRYLQPHQKEVTHILSYLAEA